MKKVLLSLMTLLALQVNAEDYVYKYLVLTDADGKQTALTVNELEITFVNGSLVAKNADGDHTLSLSTLATMQFSETGDESSDITTLINNGMILNQPADIYSLSGVLLGTYASPTTAKASLSRGLYIIKQGNNTTKISIK